MLILDMVCSITYTQVFSSYSKLQFMKICSSYFNLNDGKGPYSANLSVMNMSRIGSCGVGVEYDPYHTI